jgi:hypothetical protein
VKAQQDLHHQRGETIIVVVNARTFLLGVMLCLGCATGYGPAGLGGGYSEIRLSQRGWQITFQGNGHTSPELAHSYALRRAAELTLASGYQAFYVAGQNQSIRQTSYQQPVNCYSNGPHTNCTGGHVSTINKPTSQIDITMVTGFEAAQAPPTYLVYDARMILSQIPTE